MNKKILLAMTGLILSFIFVSGVFAQQGEILIKNIDAEPYTVFKTKGAVILVVPKGTDRNEVISHRIAYSYNSNGYISTLPDKTLVLGLFKLSDNKPYTGKGTFDLWLIDASGIPVTSVVYKADSVNITGQITLEFSSFTKTQSFIESNLDKYKNIISDSASTKFEGTWKHPNRNSRNAAISFLGNSFS